MHKMTINMPATKARKKPGGGKDMDSVIYKQIHKNRKDAKGKRKKR